MFLNGPDLSQQIAGGVCNLLSELLMPCVFMRLLCSKIRVLLSMRQRTVAEKHVAEASSTGRRFLVRP